MAAAKPATTMSICGILRNTLLAVMIVAVDEYVPKAQGLAMINVATAAVQSVLLA